jgi:hypothetical protein
MQVDASRSPTFPSEIDGVDRQLGQPDPEPPRGKPHPVSKLEQHRCRSIELGRRHEQVHVVVMASDALGIQPALDRRSLDQDRPQTASAHRRDRLRGGGIQDQPACARDQLGLELGS